MSKKIISPVLCTLLLSAFLLSLAFSFKVRQQKTYDEISQSILQDSYGNDTLSCHFSFRDPSQFDIIPCASPCFSTYDRSAYLSQQKKDKALLNKLNTISPSRLDPVSQKTYIVLKSYITNKCNGDAFPYFEQPLSPTSGIHINLPVLLCEYELNTISDIEEYLSLLMQLPLYFESLSHYENDQAKRGLGMSQKDLETVISQCEFMASDKGRQLFSDCFFDNLSRLQSIGNAGSARLLFSSPKALSCVTSSSLETEYIEKENLIFDTCISPAYSNLALSLKNLVSDKPQSGLCSYPDGKKYYEYRLKSLIGTDKSVLEIEKLLQSRLSQLYRVFSKELNTYRQKKEPALSNLSDNIPKSRYLPLLISNLSDAYPTLSGQSNVTLRKIPKALLPYTAPAYYFIPRISLCEKQSGSSIENKIYINPYAGNDPITLYTTLAHEGFPGHMYQNVYFINAEGVCPQNVLRYCMNFPGYSEGWAIYAEFSAYDHAQSLCSDKTYLRLLRLSREIQLCSLCLLDIQIHNQNKTLEDVSSVMTLIGAKDSSTKEDIYSYLINEPGTYLKYYVGYLEVLSCKSLYKKTCEKEKKEYSDVDFHTWFLSHGPDTFDNIRASLPAH